MPAKVADASVMAAIYFEEPRAEEARYLIKGDQLYEPILLAYELANVARQKILAIPD